MNMAPSGHITKPLYGSRSVYPNYTKSCKNVRKKSFSLKNGNERDALDLFVHMQREGTEFSEFTVSGVLCACAAEFAVFECRQLHAFALKASMLANIFVSTALLDVYAKCGLLLDAIRVFEFMPERSGVTWSSMVSGYVKNEFFEEALLMFREVHVSGVEFNQFIISSVLAACAAIAAKMKGFRHTREGKKYFDMMVKEHNLTPNVFHYSCMVDVLGRTGLIGEAKTLIDKMPFEATASIWGSLLSSCRVYNNVDLAEIAAKHLFEIEPDNAGNHILLSNIYAANRQWDEVIQTRKLLKETEVKKERGKSWIEIKDKVHSFMVGERNHDRIGEIYSKLEDTIKEMRKFGYRCETQHDLHNVEDNKKEELLRHHSEKLALVYGLMCLPSSAPIRIMKNLRICGDCHVFMKLASKITGREIVVRDTNRFHHFRNGFCSCGEFW
ncbi:hypothetical protein E3N88_46328 [Mikania micrantha]|uniref:DYW domain-containing protein n=1 Tax=Mikania micrantha TaxID=192012 RepID=A0A5N6L6W2_9ASTR|nr:hypothetical protein E3N88_46328 [Mikania micrantha]